MRRQKKAFTLVELLVVIGIIAVLVAILLPVLGYARKAAASVKCASNMRQCYLALRLYVEESKGYIIPVRCGGGGLSASGDQPQAVATALGKPFTLNGFSFGAGSEIAGVQTQDAAWWMNFLAPYLAKTAKGGSADNTSLTSGAAKNAVFWCAAWDGYQQNLPGADTNRQATGYAMNYMLNASTTVPNLLSASAICPFQGWCFANLKTAAGDNSPDPATTGKWYKINQVTRQAERPG
jgi:prepilin-type N-terminal cleavage/methylation domain-containing protein